MLCLEPQDGEDDRARVDGGEHVAGGEVVHVSHAVLVLGVVAAEADDRAEGQAVGIKHLGGGLQPDLGVQELFHLYRRNVLIFYGFYLSLIACL